MGRELDIYTSMIIIDCRWIHRGCPFPERGKGLRILNLAVYHCMRTRILINSMIHRATSRAKEISWNLHSLACSFQSFRDLQKQGFRIECPTVRSVLPVGHSPRQKSLDGGIIITAFCNVCNCSYCHKKYIWLCANLNEKEVTASLSECGMSLNSDPVRGLFLDHRDEVVELDGTDVLSIP